MMVVPAFFRRRLPSLLVVAASAFLTNCSLDELLSPTALGTLSIAPLELVDSARVGSTAPRTTTVALTITGTIPTLKFGVTAELGSTWITGGLGVGTAPNDLTITLNPSGLAVGEYSDTLRFTNDGPDARLVRVPVTLKVLPCAVTELASIPATESGVLTAEDCAATGQTDRFAKRFRFEGTAGDSISARVGPSAFAARVTLRREGSATELAAAEDCPIVGDGACVRYVRLPETGTYEVEVTSASPRVTGTFDLSVTRPRAPSAPSTLSQRSATDLSSVIAAGATVGADRIALQGAIADADSDSLRLEVELRPLATPFSNVATSTTALTRNPTIANTITGLLDNTQYRWQARTVDQTGRASAWVAFGSGTADFSIGVAEAPNAPTLLVQRRSDGVTPIAIGATTNEPIVRLGATVSDPDPSDQIRLEFEVRTVGTPFTNVATQSSAASPSGTAVLTSVAGLVDNGQYRWQARAVDQTGRASAWVSLGGTTAHFRTAIPPAAVAFVQQPTDAAAGAALTPAVRVAVQDVNGNTLASFSGPVTIALQANPSGATLSGTTTVSAVAGVASFTDLSLDKVASGYTLRATVGAFNSTSSSFAITSSAADRMELGAVPTTIVAGTTFAPALQVTVRDALGNVATGFTGNITLALAPNGADAQLLGTTTVAAVAGVASFSDVRIERAASDLTLLVTAAGLANVSSAPVTVTAGAANALRIATAPNATAASGVPFAQQPALELDDVFGNLITTAGTTVSATLASGPDGASLVNAGATTDLNGRATFSGLAIVGPAGSYTLTFAAGALTSAPTGTITIGAGVATKLSLRTPPSPTIVNGESFVTPPRVRLRDAAENNVLQSDVPVTVSIATGGGTLLGTTTVLTNTTGEATFSDLGILGTVGERTLTFAAPGLTSVTTDAVTLTAGAATTLELNAGDAQSAPAASNVAIAPSVVARDVSGNAVAGVEVTFAVASGGGSISPTTAVTTDASGIAALTSWTLGGSAGTNTLTATAGTLDGSPILFTATATAGAASQMVITGGDNLTGPVGTTLATPHEVRVTDATGNPVAGVTVNWSAVGGGSVAPLTTITDADGRASATRTLGPVAGSKTTVASATLAGGPASVTFTVTATVGGATQLALVTGDAQVDTVGATLPVPLTVVVRDALNNPVEGVLISWSVLAGGGSVSPASAPTNASGIATTNWTLGTVRTATDSTQIARASGVGSPVTFVALARPGAVSATQTSVVVAPASVAASRTTPATVTVTARDGFGNPVAGVPVTLAATGAGNTIAQPTAVTNASGVATGSIGATVTGARTVSATVNGVLATSAPALTVVAAPPAALLFITSPLDGTAGEDLTPAPAVGVVDSLGNRNLTFAGTVTLGIGTNAGAGVLSGSTSRSAVAGVATFPGIAIDKAGVGYKLEATSAGLTAAESESFTLGAGLVDGALSSIAASPTSIVAGTGSSTITVTARDANGNVVPGATVVLEATGSGNTLTQPVGVTDANGVATGTLSASVIGARSVSATVNGVALATTTSVTVVPGAVSPTLSTITGIPTTLVAGVEVSAVTVTARDVLGNPVSGATVVIAATGLNNTIVQPASVTNASGVATGSFGSTVAEAKTLSATINGVALSSAVTVDVTPGAISAARSLVAAAPTSVVAGGGSSTITVTARDANDNVISGASVVLAATGAGNTLVQPAGPTDALGVATGSISSSASGTKTITATIGGIAITQSATVTVTSGGLSTTQSTLESDLSSVAAGDSVTVTVTARDANGNPVSNLAVVLGATGSSNTITQPAAVTDANGVATGRVLSTVAEDKTITATVDGQALAQSALVTFTPAAASDTASTVVVDPTTIAADGSSATVTVTVRDRFANAISGTSVVLAASGTGNTLTQPASVTDANGVATGSISSTVVGTKLISATADALALADTVALTVAPAGISATQSSVTIDPTALTAGAGSSVITVTARDGNGNVVPGATVVLAATGAGNTLTQPAAVTDANGVATGTIASTGAGIKTISATIDGVVVTQTAALTVSPAAISASVSTLATSTTIVAAGTGSSTLTVTARDAFGNPVAGAAVVLSATGDGNTLTQPAAVTNALGVATGSFTSATSEAKTISATAGGVTLAQSVVITVVPDVASPTTSTVSISSNTLVAGSDTATVTVTARDGSGNIVPGVTVVLASTNADLILLQPAATTDANGVATGRVVGTLVGSKTISATLNGVTANATVAVTVTPASVSGDSSTIAASVNTLEAGAATATLLVTARDAFGNLISDATVVLAATGAGNSLTQPASLTNASGQASGTISSTATGAKIVSATVNGVALAGTDTITVTAAGVSATQSTIALSASSITAGGAAGTITVTARDEFGNVISGATVLLEATGTSNTLTQPASPTNASGVTTGTFASTIAGVRAISASINGTPVAVPQQLTVTAAAVSATQSTLGSDPGTIVAGIGTSTITVRARDQFGNNIEGATVLLIASGSSNTLTQPASVTDVDGFATGALASSVAEAKAITAIVNGVTLASGLEVTVTPGAVSAANSALSVSPSSLTAGAGSSTITVTARDANNNVIPGATVVLASSGAAGTLTQPADVTSGAGVATGSFAASTVGLRTISATVNGVAITATANITVNAAPFSAAQSTISLLPTSIVAGGSGTTVTVTVRDAFDNPISGATVAVASSGTGNTITQPVATTDANGVATATVATTVAEAKTISATVNGSAITQTAQLAVTPGAVSAAQSTVEASASSITAGSGTSTITVTARDANGNVIPNASVTLASTGSGNTITPSSGTTDAAGQFSAAFSATVGGARSISATIDAVAITQTASVTVTAAGISAAQSLVAVSPGSLIAQQDTATVTITVRDEFNNPVSGVAVTLAATGSNNGIVQPTLPTDVNGVTTGRFASTTAELKTITATADATPLTQTASVTVTPAAVSAAQSTLSALPTTITAGTTDSTAVTVTARDAFGNLISGATVVLGATGGTGNTVIQPSAVTDANGVATGYVRSTGAGVKTISATIAGTAVTQTASVTVVAAGISTTTSSIAVGSPTISAGAGTTSVTVTVRDAFSNPIAGVTVVLAATGTDNTITQPVGVTNAAGVATGSFSSLVSEAKTLSATANGQAIVATVGVNVVPDAASASESLVSASDNSIVAGAESSIITVTARDANGNPVPGVSVTLEASALDVTITQPASVTDANGETTGSIEGTIVGTKTITALLNGVPATATVDVEVTPAAPSTTQSTASATPTTISAGSGASDISVTVRDAFGNLVPNTSVSFSATGLGNNLPSSANTDANGVANVSFSSTVVGSKTITVTLSTGDLPSTLTVTVQPGAAFPGKSTLATSATDITTDGSATITVQLRDADENLLTSPSGTVLLSTTLGTLSSVTNVGNGTYTATLTSTAIGTATISGTLNGDALENTVDVQVAIGAPSVAATTIVAAPTSITTDGSATITVQVTDAAGNDFGVSAGTVELFTSLGSLTAVTDNGDGSYTATLTSATTGTATITGELDNVAITDNAVVTVGIGTPSLTQSTVSAAEASRTTDEFTTITVQLKDASGNNLTTSGGTVVLATTRGTLTPVVNNNNGTYTATLSSTSVGDAVVTAALGLDALTLNATVTFTVGAASLATSTITSSVAALTTDESATITVQLRDAGGNALVSTGGLVTLATTRGLLTEPVTNNGDGTYTATLTSGSIGGATITGTLNGNPFADSDSVTISVGAPAQLAFTTQPSASTVAGVAFAQQPVVTIRDAAGNTVTTSSASVSLALTTGTGTLSGTTSVNAVAGVATFSGLSINAAGADKVLTASSGALPTITSNVFAITAGGATQISLNAGDAQTAIAGQAVLVAPSVLVRDANNNPVSGVAVTFAVASGNGGITGGSALTNASGIATVGSWTLGTTAGANSLTASAAGLSGSQVTFNATGTAGAATQIAINDGNGQTAIAGANVAVAPSVIVRDANGNAVSGVSVTFAVASGNGGITGGTTSTNASGIATVGSWTLGTTAGANTLSATSAGLTGSPLTFTATGTAGAAAQISTSAGNGQTAIAGSNVGVAPSVLVVDSNGNPVNGVGVTFAIASGNGSLTGASATTNASGIATVGSWTLGAIVGANSITATSGTLTGSPLTFTATGIAGAASQIAVNAGNAQSAIAGQAVAVPPSVDVRDANGNAVSGVAVTFAIASGGGGLTGASTTTDINGIATVGSWTLGTTAGANSITATSGTLSGSPVTITATGVAGAATQIAINAGNGQTAVAGANVLIAPSVIVRDANGNVVSGVGVTFAIASGGGSLTGASATTDVNGIATVGSWTLGAVAGANSVTATSAGLTGSPLTFTATGSAGGATQIAANAGNGQLAIAGAAVATPPSVIVRDVNSNPVSGVEVVFAVATGNGQITSGTTTTNGSGIATVGSWTLGTTAGDNSLTASAAGLTGSPVTFTATGTAGAATEIAINSGNAQSATVGTAVTTPPSVVVRDANNNAVSGVEVTFAVASGNGGITGATATTNASGIATIGSWTLGLTAGENTLTATSAGLTGSPLTFTATGTAGTPTTMSLSAGDAQTVTVGNAVAIAPAVLVRDANNNPVSGVAVTFSVTAGGGSVIGGAATTNASGIAAVTSWTLGTTAGANTLQATSAGLTGSPITFTATGTASAATQIAVNAGNAQTAVAGQAVATPPSVIVRDASNNPVEGVTVTFAVVSGGGNLTGASATTNASGIATVGSWVLGTTAGANSLTASSGSLAGSPVTFTATGTPGAATKLAFTTQPSASTVAGTAFAQQPVVTVRDANDNTVTSFSDAVVVALTTGSGVLSGTTSVNAIAGVATFSGLSINLAGTDKVLTASSGALTTATTAAFSIVAGSATQIAINAGDAQTAVAGSAVPVAPSVIVRDANSNPVSGVSVTFAVASGNGSVVGENATTDASGIAAVTSWTLGATAGANSITATSGSLTGSPVTFTATGTAGAATQIAINAGNNQSATVGSAVLVAPSVIVRDGNNNPVSGVSVTFAVASGGGSVTGESTTTNGSGIATLGSWTLGTTAGTNTITATSAGLTGSPLTFTATGTAGAATQISLNAGDAQTAVAGSTVTIPPSVLVRDASNNPVSGVAVTFAVTAGNGILVGENATTNASGIATLGSWTLGTVAGTNTITASSGSLSGSPVSFNATGTPGTATQIVFTTQPSSSTVAGVAFAAQPVVTIRDSNGNTVTGATNAITLALSSGTGTLSGTTTVNAVGGVATFSGLSINLIGTDKVLTASASGFTSTTSNTFTIVAGAATQIAISAGDGQSATVGASVATAPSVIVRDANNNPVSGVGVTFAVASGGGSALGLSATTDASGIATVGSWTLGTTAGANTLTATSGSLTGSPVTFTATGTAGTATQLAFTTQPSASTVAGTAFAQQPVVTIRDASGNTVTTATDAVTLTLTTGTGTLSGLATVNAINGVATFSGLSINLIGANKVLTASALNLASTTTNAFAITAAAAASIALNDGDGQSATVGTAVATAPSVIVRDALTNPVSGVGVTFAITAGSGVLVGENATTDANGIAALTSWTLGAIAGTNTVTATNGALSGSPVTFNATGTAGTATQLAFTTQPSASTVAGAAFAQQPVVTIRDANGNTVSSTAAVTLALTTGSGTLSGTTTVNAVSGVATFTDLSINLVGTDKVLTATSDLLTSATSTAFTITVGAASEIAINDGDGQTATAGANVATPPSVIVRDANSNTVSGVSVTFAVASGDGSATGLETTTNASGIATVGSWTLGTTAGANTLTATSGSLTGSPLTFTATGVAGAATNIAIAAGDGQSATVGTNVGIAPSVLVTDSNGNPVTGVAVEFAVVLGGGSVSGGSATTNGSGIAAVTSWTLGAVAGTNTLTATSGSLTGSPLTFTATGTAGGATQITLNGGDNQTAVAGSAVGTAPSVLVRDASNNPVSGVGVTFAVASGGGSVTGESVLTNASGIATLGSWILGTTAGTNTLTATSGSLTGSPVTFTATGTFGTASQLAVTTQPSPSTVAGVAFAQQPVVTIRDANGNTVTNATDAVTLAITTGTGTLSGTATVNAVNGVATFSGLSIDLIGTNKVLTASSGSLASATTNAFTIVASTATQISINAGNGQTVTVNSAVPVLPSVLVRDALNNPVSGVSVTFAVASGGGNATGLNAVTDASGIATVGSWTLGTVAGANTLTATNGTLTGSPVTFTATGIAGVASQIAFTTQPSASTVAGTAFAQQPVVTIRDSNGNTVTGATDAITLTLSTGSGALSGTATVNAVGGVATFSGLSINLIGTDKVLTAAATGFSSVTSNAFTITAGPASQMSLNLGDGQTATAGSAVSVAPSVLVRDALNNPVNGVSVTFAVTAGGGVLVGENATTNASGIATLGSWTLGTTAGTNTLTATSGSLGGSPVTFNATGTAGTATQLAFTTQPSASTVAGVAFAQQPVVTIRDANGNTVSSTAAVTLALTTGSGTLSGTTTINAVGGVATFSGLSLDLIGSNKVLTASSGLLSTAASNAFTITAAAATAANTTISVGNAARTADQTTTVTVQLIDQFGNALSSSSGTVLLDSDIGDITGLSDLGNGTWTATFVAIEVGTATITGTLNGTPITDNAQVVVTAGAVSTATTTASADLSEIEASSGATVSTITVVARDADNNPVPGVTVALSATGSNNTLTQPSGVTDASGIATGTLSSETAELKTVSATVNTAAVTDDETVTVIASTPSPANIQITVDDADITSDETAAITIQLIDEFGNLRTSNDGAITLNTNIGSVTSLSDNGDGTWAATFDGGAVGVATITGFWSGNPITDNASVTVTAGAPSQIAINAGNGQSAIAGQAVGIDPSVIVRDAANNPVAGVEVTFAIASGGGVLTDSVVVTDGSGIATLGSWTLGTAAGANSITATAPGLTGSPLTFTATGNPGDATQLVFTTQPTNTTVNATISTFVVEARDVNGNLATGFNGDVTVSVNAGGSGSLTGTVTLTASSGVITYTNVQANTAQTGLIIRAAFPGLTDGLSVAIDITP